MKSLEALANKTKRTRDQAQSKRDQQVRAAVKRSQDEVAISHQGVDIKV